jgi:hypothetical protein
MKTRHKWRAKPSSLGLAEPIRAEAISQSGDEWQARDFAEDMAFQLGEMNEPTFYRAATRL